MQTKTKEGTEERWTAKEKFLSRISNYKENCGT